MELSLEKELERQAEEIKKELAAHPELENIYVTVEMDKRMKARFQRYLIHRNENGKDKKNE